MTTVRTDLGNTRESARRLRVEPTGSIDATNIQEALEEIASQGQAYTVTAVSTSPYAVLPSDTLIEVSLAGATIALDAASLHEGRDLIIKDTSGTVSTTPTNITGGGVVIGDPLQITTDHGGWHLSSAGGVWRFQP